MNKNPVGRPHTKHDIKRIKLNKFRLPRRWVRWLLKQNDSGGRLIERALEDYYQIDWEKEIGNELGPAPTGRTGF